MMYKNTLKLFMSNFNLVWKQLLYALISILIVTGLASLVAFPFIEMLKAEGWVNELNNFTNGIYTSSVNAFDSFKPLVEKLWSLIVSYKRELWFTYFLIIFVILVVSKILYYISVYTLSEVVNGKMSSLTKYGYTNKLVATLGKSIKCAFISILISVPFFIIKGCLFYLYAVIPAKTIPALLLLQLFVLIALLVDSYKLTILSGFIPAVINDEKECVLKGFRKGLYHVSKRFARTFSTMLMLSLTLLVANIILGVFTLGLTLFITLPSIPVIMAICGLVMYYGSTERRFYLSENLIVNAPKKSTKKEKEKL